MGVWILKSVTADTGGRVLSIIMQNSIHSY